MFANMRILNSTIYLILTFIFNMLLMFNVQAFNASVSSKYTYDNNVFKSRNNKKSDFIMTVSPKLKADLSYQTYVLNLDYSSDLGRYVEQSGEDYLRQKIGVSFYSDPRAEYAVMTSYHYASSFDARGLAGNNTTTVLPDLWANNAVKAELKYKYEDGNSLKFAFGLSKKRFDRFESRIKNTDSQNLIFSHEIKLSGKTNVLYSIERASIIYINVGGAQFDSLEMNYKGGLIWLFSGKTTSYVNLGWKTKENIAKSEQVYSGLIFDVGINWEHTKYSTYDVSFIRNTTTNPVSGSTNGVTNSANLAWQRYLNRKISLNFLINSTLSQFNTGESDFVFSIGSALSYQMARWFQVQANVITSSKKSSVVDAEYDSYLASLQFQLSY